MIASLIFLLCSAGVVTMICRINHMTAETSELVAWQHYLMTIGFAATPIVWFLGGTTSGPVYALLVLSGAMAAYLLMGAHSVPSQRSIPADRSARKRMHQDWPA